MMNEVREGWREGEREGGKVRALGIVKFFGLTPR